MLEKFRNQERLSIEEEDRIDRNIRIFILVLMAVIIAVLLWIVIAKKPLGAWYNAVIITVLAVVWFTKCVLSAILRHALAQRSDEQVSVYLKGAGLELLSYAGLCWFLVGLNGNGIYGAIVYLIGMTGARKQREIYYQEPGEEEESDSGAEADTGGSSDEPDTTEPDTAGSGDEPDTGSQDPPALAQAASDSSESALGALPSAADRILREKESEDGSV